MWFSQYLDFFAHSDSRFSNSFFLAKYYPILTNHTSMEILFIQLSDNIIYIYYKDPYDWFCGPGSQINNNNNNDDDNNNNVFIWYYNSKSIILLFVAFKRFHFQMLYCQAFILVEKCMGIPKVLFSWQQLVYKCFSLQDWKDGWCLLQSRCREELL